MYTLSFVILCGFFVYTFLDNGMLLFALPLIGFALHWLRCNTRDPFNCWLRFKKHDFKRTLFWIICFVTNVKRKRSLVVKMNRGQGIFNDKVIDSLNKLLLYVEDYFLLIAILSFMVHQIVAQLMELDMGLYFYHIISVICTIFCVILLFELLISFRVDLMMLGKFFSPILKEDGDNENRIGIKLFPQWMDSLQISDQLLYWWLFKFLWTIVSLVLTENGFAVNFTLPTQESRHLSVFTVRREQMDESIFVSQSSRHLLFHEEIVYSESMSFYKYCPRDMNRLNTNHSYELHTQPEQMQVPLSRTSDFYLLVALATCCSNLVSQTVIIFGISRLSSVLLQALIYVLEWRLPPLVLMRQHYNNLQKVRTNIHSSLILMAFSLDLRVLQVANRIYWMPFMVVEFGNVHLLNAVYLVEPILQSLPPVSNSNRLVHFRSLVISLLLAVLPLLLIYYLFAKYNYEMSSWLLINCLCCFFVSIEAVRSIVTYALSMLAYNRFVISLDSHDQWLFRIRRTTGAIDVAIIIVKTIVFGYSLISIFSVMSLLNLVTLCLNFKNNTWPRIKSAWAIFQLRLLTYLKVSKIINFLATVTPGEIINKGVCPICQDNFPTDRDSLLIGQLDQAILHVKRTPCRHYFHISR